MGEATKKEKNIGMAAIAYILFFLPLLTEAKKDPFVKYHIKQGLTLFLAGLITRTITWIPFIGWSLIPPLNLFLSILFVIGMINVFNGKKKPLPIIGKFAEKFKL